MEIPWRTESTRFYLKILIVMKALFLCCAFTVLYASNVLSQQSKSAHENVSMDQVLLKLSQTVQYDLVYDAKIFNGQKKVDIDFKNTPLRQALNQLFANSLTVMNCKTGLLQFAKSRSQAAAILLRLNNSEKSVER